ncbi:PREDICTED: cell growth regulator with RING finger domain protein 1-like [Branchiostoma belcheri]|uniref:Cell growth regulator with RING finger domain protein 1-like n=1 Tax=Branchiostoma belcheri TaxID=7741 RepID=A0A6P5A2V5_BRABE|nr:PREDICTED: cell growth regulator with RING finger domain protein 1-like [Branchiostoma belcheri]
MAVLLEPVFEVSTIFSILSVVFTFISMVVFIIRLQHDTSIVHQTGQNIPVVRMQSVSNPFVLEVHRPQQASVSDGLSVQLTSKVPAVLSHYWGVHISSFHELLQDQTPGLLPSSQQDKIKDICFKKEEDIMIPPCENHVEHLLLSGQQEEEGKRFGRSPRSVYPVVLVLKRQETAADMSIAGMISVVHVPDADCADPCQVLCQYLLTGTGNMYDLKRLYMAVDDSADQTMDEPFSTKHEPDQETEQDDTAKTSDDSTTEEDVRKDCVVCQNGPINRVLLPCRHACVCDACAAHFRQCPMCRQDIASSFCMQHSEGSEQAEEEEGEGGGAEEPAIVPWPAWVDNMMRRLNTWVGLDE